VLDMGREVRPILSELAAKKFAQAFETGDASVLHKQAPPSTNGASSDWPEPAAADPLKRGTTNPDAQPLPNRPDGDPVDGSPSPIGGTPLRGVV
jgi:hypothetical protein